MVLTKERSAGKYLVKRSWPLSSSTNSRGSSGSALVKTLNTELSSDKKFPFAVVLLKISAQKRGLGVLSESQHGMRNATGLLPEIECKRSTERSYVSLALAKPPLKKGQGWSTVWHSRLNHSLSQACSCGSL